MKAFGRHGVVGCLVVLVAAGLAAPADSAAAVTLRDFDVSVRGSRVSSDYRISTGRPRSFDQMVVATRDASGRHHDFGHRSPTIDGRRSFVASTRLPPGRYRSRIAYTFNGRRWFDLRPRRKFRVRNPDASAQSTTPSERKCGGGEVNEPAGGPWRLAFRDEFNDAELDTTKWDWKYPRSGDMIYSNRGNGEAQWYRRENLREANGCLRLVAKRERTVSPYSGETFDYTSGLIQSKPSFNFRYGYLEARMRLPGGSGFWPAFWTWPSNEQWPPEIDVMEFYGDSLSRLYLAYHGEGGSTGTTVSTQDWTSGWHTFAVHWEPGRLTWYVDGVPRKTVDRAPALDMYLIANLAIANGDRAPAPSSSTPFPSALKIDYIRVWQPL